MTDFPSSATEIIDRILQTAKAAVPEALGNDVKENVRAALQDVISELDVVTKEELDVQKEVLARTRAKVDELETIILDLEQRLALK